VQFHVYAKEACLFRLQHKAVLCKIKYIKRRTHCFGPRETQHAMTVAASGSGLKYQGDCHRSRRNTDDISSPRVLCFSGDGGERWYCLLCMVQRLVQEL